MVDLSKYDAETIEKAFWLQQKIKDEGTPAVRFMATARKTLRREAPEIVADHIGRRITKI